MMASNREAISCSEGTPCFWSPFDIGFGEDTAFSRHGVKFDVVVLQGPELLAG